MKMSYDVRDVNEHGTDAFFPLGRVVWRNRGRDLKRLHLGSVTVDNTAQLSQAQVLAILSEAVTQTNAKIKIEFEEGVILEFE